MGAKVYLVFVFGLLFRPLLCLGLLLLLLLRVFFPGLPLPPRFFLTSFASAAPMSLVFAFDQSSLPIMASSCSAAFDWGGSLVVGLLSSDVFLDIAAVVVVLEVAASSC